MNEEINKLTLRRISLIQKLRRATESKREIRRRLKSVTNDLMKLEQSQ